MKLKIVLTEDQVLNMLATHMTRELGRETDPNRIEDLEATGDGDDFISFEIETESLGEKTK